MERKVGDLLDTFITGRIRMDDVESQHQLLFNQKRDIWEIENKRITSQVFY